MDRLTAVRKVLAGAAVLALMAGGAATPASAASHGKAKAGKASGVKAHATFKGRRPRG
ncbi:MAG TPA: hypothetical protein VF533_19355 [Solirubrobacteraceae bacterium]|jgi:hypothetical protein